jgi:hypothetical protein
MTIEVKQTPEEVFSGVQYEGVKTLTLLRDWGM